MPPDEDEIPTINYTYLGRDRWRDEEGRTVEGEDTGVPAAWRNVMIAFAREDERASPTP